MQRLALTLPALEGAPILDLTSLRIFSALTLDGLGEGSTALGPPNLPALPGLTLQFQTVNLAGDGQLLISNPTTLPIL